GWQGRVGGGRGGAACGQRGGGVVDERGEVPEQQRAGGGGGGGGLHLPHLDAAPADLPHQLGQGGQVVDVLQALPRGLEHDREVGMGARHLEQARGALALLPQRCALVRVA